MTNPTSALSGNMAYLSYPYGGSYSDMLAGCTQTQHNYIGFTDLLSSHLGENANNYWRDGRNDILFVQANGGDELIRNSITDDPETGLQAHLHILNGPNSSLQHSSIPIVHSRGLSLSLGSENRVPSFKYQTLLSSHQSSQENSEKNRDDNTRNKIMNVSFSNYRLTNSKYLEAAQLLLDEVVNIQNASKKKPDNTHSVNTSSTPVGKDNDAGSKSEGNPSNHQDSTANSSSELSPSERQELQNKLTKLLTMLDEVDRRYKQYYNQMQIVVSSFNAVAGSCAAKPYTVLALQTISRHFRCLRDAICIHIKTTRKILGDQDGSSGKGCGISRLSFIDQHTRQQRAIQQLGVIPQHAWRPQRGLPECSVSILRAWLFEHFLHPYPNDSEKLMLARQTGLTRGQVSNWFINARVRLWKPMIEEMYKKEIGDADIDSNSSSENATKGSDDPQSLNLQENQPCSATERCQTNPFLETIAGHEITGFRSELRGQRPQDSADVNLIINNPICHTDESSRFLAYSMNDLAGYRNGRVSLSLGLQHCDSNLPASDDQQTFLAMRGEEMYNTGSSLAFGPSHLLHDFVA